jgi:peptidoglycan/LPS O-acetylase OafA/YrhL
MILTRHSSAGQTDPAGSNAALAYVPQIDALRGIAALVVSLIFHVHYVIGKYRTGPLDGLPVFTWIHDYGWTMVDLFFLISGFVFSHVYLTRGGLRDGVSFRGFMVARLARLYPLHLLTLVVVAVILWFGRPATWRTIGSDPYHFVLNLFFLQETGLNERYSFNYPSWSISVEMMCYLAFILAALRGVQFFRQAALFLIAMGMVMTFSGNDIATHVGRGFFGFFVGHLVWRYRAELAALPTWLLTLVAVAGPVVPTTLGFNYGNFLCATSWTALLLLAFRSQILASAPFRWLGDRSYSIYMLHAPVYAATNVFVFGGKPVDQVYWPVVSAGTAVIILTLAHFSFLYFERPARNAINAWARRARVPVAKAGTPQGA